MNDSQCLLSEQRLVELWGETVDLNKPIVESVVAFGQAVAAAAVEGALTYPSSSEGTVRCTCGEYPHALGCGSLIGQRGWEAGYKYAQAVDANVEDPQQWVLMPRQLTEYEATMAQGALMDFSWDAVQCFVARYEALIKYTQGRRNALAKQQEQKI